MRLSVLHRTTFYYHGAIFQNENHLHLEPRTFPYQKTLSSIIRVMPATRLIRYIDLFENVCHRFELLHEHSRLEVESRIKVHNLPLMLTDFSKQADLTFYQDSEVQEQTWQFMHASRHVDTYGNVWQIAHQLTESIDSIFRKSWTIMEWINASFTYEKGTTCVESPFQQIFHQKTGVCQDFAHIMIGMCRSVGIPARYASGYLYNGPLDHLVGAQASHAWAEVFLPTAGWIGFDPTNRTLADERYVKIAVGRDYEDVAPIKGNYHGTGSQMEVQVEVKNISV